MESGGGQIKRSLRRVLTPARHGTMCGRKPRNEAGGREQHFSETMALFLASHGKNTGAMAVMVCLGTSRHRCCLAPVLQTRFLLFRNNSYSHSVFWKGGLGGPLIVGEIRGAVPVLLICVW
jgi:hypothetical protein